MAKKNDFVVIGGRRINRVRFWQNVIPSTVPDACWLWVGKHYVHGYGEFGISVRSSSGKWEGVGTSAHRVMYALIHKRWPNHEAGHICNVRNCVNPDHLIDCTHQENITYREMSNRTTGCPPKFGAFSEACCDALVGQDIGGGMIASQKDVAEWLGVSQARVSQYLTGGYRSVQTADVQYGRKGHKRGRKAGRFVCGV